MSTEPPGPGTDLAVYVHWPFCARICPYCDFNVVRARGQDDRARRLTAAILADLEGQAARIGPRKVVSVFLGGGTPSLMDPADVAAVIEAVRRLFPAGGPVEVTLEANPTDAEADRFAAFAAAGVNRLSMGVQALDDAQLAFLGRNHSAAEARRAVAMAARAFSRQSIDLIHALPGQSVADWRAALGQALDLGFEHVSPYQLTIAQGTAFARAVGRGDWAPPDEDLSAALYEATQQTLGAASFDAYEVSNHARDVAARSTHNLHVWRGGDYLGVGPGAHGRLTRDGIRTATVAHRQIEAYVAGVAAGSPWSESPALSPREAAEERVLLGLRTVEGVPLSVLDALPAAARPLGEMVEEGFLMVVERRLIATAAGRPLLDAVTSRLLTA